MDEKPAKVPAAELAVLQVLWERGPATVRQLSDAVYPGGGSAQYGTVHKLLERLESKNYVKRERRGRKHLFLPTVGRDELLGRELEALVDKMCGGSLQPLLSHLIRVKGLTPEELHELLVLIEKLGAEPKPDRRRPKKGAE
jgi:BlaI family transcriptional regulator, penicillinase repressor